MKFLLDSTLSSKLRLFKISVSQFLKMHFLKSSRELTCMCRDQWGCAIILGTFSGLIQDFLGYNFPDFWASFFW